MKQKGNTDLAQARLAACRKWPFATSAILSLVPVESPGLGTCAVDQHWRLYYDPEFLKAFKPEIVAGLVCHEVSHLLLKHAARAKTMVAKEHLGIGGLWNIATDCAINEQLRKEEIPLPEGACYPEVFGLEPGHAAEHYYRQLVDREHYYRQSVDQAEQAMKTLRKVLAPILKNRNHQGDDIPPLPGISGSCADGERKPWEADPPEDEETRAETHEQPQQSSDDSKGGGNGDGQAEGEGAATVNNAKAEKPPAGIPEHEADQLIREVAQKAIKASGTRRGDALFGKWAEDILHPKIDPKVLLMRAVRRSLQPTSGGCDEWTYRRPSRRQSHGNLLRPAPITITPRVVVLIDTSGSMDKRDLSLAVGLVAKVLSGLRLRDGIQVYAGDTGVHVATKCFGPRDVVLAGGGGTDVGAMLEQVYESSDKQAKPDVMLAITDGYTPWPDQPLPCHVVACLTSDERSGYNVPSWIQSVVLNP